MFVKYNDFSVSGRQCSLEQPTDVTALILNAARRMLPEAWDGVTPLRQVGLGVSKLTHESAVQMSLFEDPKMEYYREWDRQYDERMASAEDARMLAYERKNEVPAVPEGRQSATVATPQSLPARRGPGKSAIGAAPDVLVFTYPDGEKALAAAKSAVRAHHDCIYGRKRLPDGTDCFTSYPSGLMAMGENIAAGYTSAESVTEAWKETDDDYAGQGHRRNMLASMFKQVGIAGYMYHGRMYWAQAFGRY